MKHILFIIGSLRKESFNLQLAREAEKQLAGVAEVTYLDYTDVPSINQDIEHPLFRIIQSIPSPKAEPFKQWMAQVAAKRLDQMQDPELSFEQAVADYRRLGYTEAWINQRMRSIEVRKHLTDEWKRSGLEEGHQFASLTDIIYRQCHRDGFRRRDNQLVHRADSRFRKSRARRPQT